MAIRSLNSWPGILRVVPLLLVAIFVCSLATFALAVVNANEISNTPLDDPRVGLGNYRSVQKPSSIRTTLYLTTMPILSILHSIADLTLFSFATCPPPYALLASGIAIVGWLTQWSIWTSCEVTLIAYPGKAICLGPIIDQGAFPYPLSGATTRGRIGLGFVVLALYFTVFGFAAAATAAAVHKARMAKIGGSVDVKRLGSEDLLVR